MKGQKDTRQDRLMFGDKNRTGTIMISILLSVAVTSLALYIGGMTHQFLSGYKTTHFGIPQCIGIGSSAGKIETIVFMVIVWIVGIMLLAKKTKDDQDDRNLSMSARDTYGTSRFMSKAEAQKNLEVSPIQKNTGFILGKLGQDVVSLPQDTMFNRHILVMGAPGTRKSRSFVRPAIFQSVRNGQSCIVTDPKGEMYRDTAAYMRKNGYDVKVFNLVETKHSDSWACLKEIGGDQDMAAVFADVIMSNLVGSDTKKTEFWFVSAKNLIKAMILYVSMDKKMIEQKKDTIGETYRILTTSSISELKDMFERLDHNHPAHMPFAIFAGATPTIQESVKHELGVFLEVFQTQTIREITSYEEIDLEKPAYSKCAYFVIMSDQHTTLSFLSSLFFSFLFIKLVNYADNETEDGRCPVPVNMILDEFPNIGSISGFIQKLSTVRGRYINISIIIQSLSQIIDMYGKNYESILSNCDTHLFLGGNDPTTIKYISDRAGIVGVDQLSSNTHRQTFAPVEFLPEYHLSRGEGKRNLLNQDEVYTLDPQKSLVFIRSLHVLKVDKFDYTEHPASKQLISENARSHIPEWQSAQCEKNAAEPIEDRLERYPIPPVRPKAEDIPPQSKPRPKTKRSSKSSTARQPENMSIEDMLRQAANPNGVPEKVQPEPEAQFPVDLYPEDLYPEDEPIVEDAKEIAHIKDPTEEPIPIWRKTDAPPTDL